MTTRPKHFFAKLFPSFAVASVLLTGPTYALQLPPQDSALLPMAENSASQPGADTGTPDGNQIAQSARAVSSSTAALALNELAPVSDNELSQSRGGFLTANGIEFDFGANIQTLVNGQLALQTSVQWNPTGATVQQTLGSGTNVVAIPSSQLTALFGAGNGIVTNGVQITAPTGSIEVAANVAGSQVQNLVANSASNQSISQNTAVTLAIYNFASWQQQLAQHALANQLANEALASRIGQ
jgi:hypothetical protein